MAIEVKVPIADQTTEEVRIVAWKKSVGDAVKHGEVVLEIETDKDVMEVESVGEGVLLRQLVDVDDMVAVGKVIGFIGESGEIVDAVADETESVKPVASAEVSEEKVPQETSAGYKVKKTAITPLARKIAEKTGLNLDTIEGTGAHRKILRKDLQASPAKASLHEGRLFASPNARRLAKELAVDIYSIPGTGPRGRVIGEDVIEYAKNKPSTDHTPAEGQPQPGTEVELTKMRRAIGVNLQRSFRDTPHFNVTM
ncbi:MAG: E3 binding domain-containing protein, partial [Planctomycetes bacterium]|nr:E3 binding domain-containing protein [Planctomycetota bacterium]